MNLEAATGRRYSFGAWAPTQTLSDAQWGGSRSKQAWDASVNNIPDPIRKAMTELVRGNLLSDEPMPMFFKVALGADHGIKVGYGQDKSISPPAPAILVTMICKK